MSCACAVSLAQEAGNVPPVGRVLITFNRDTSHFDVSIPRRLILEMK